jgi:hypothetical protein
VNVLLVVTWRRPAIVIRMRLADVNEQERGAVAIRLIDLLDGVRLTPEGRSGETAEDQDQRPIGLEF